MLLLVVNLQMKSLFPSPTDLLQCSLGTQKLVRTQKHFSGIFIGTRCNGLLYLKMFITTAGVLMKKLAINLDYPSSGFIAKAMWN